MGFTTEHGPQFTYRPPAAVGHVVNARARDWRCTCGKEFRNSYRLLADAVAEHGAKLIGAPASWTHG